MVNALANHGYLPRDGKNVSMLDLITGFDKAVHLSLDATLIVGFKALETSTTGSWTTFHLDDLNKHGIIEHDGSLSRNDIYFGDNHSFDPGVWAGVKAFFGDKDIIDLSTAARARAARLQAARAANPKFTFEEKDARASFIETALYLSVMKDPTKDGARRDWVETLFGKQLLRNFYDSII